MNNSSRQMINPAIQARIDFFEKLATDVQNSSEGSELRILYEKFGNFCINLGIANSFGRTTFRDETCNDEFRKELLSNIDMAKHVCMSKRDNISSGSSLTINNNNQQELNQNISLNIQEILKKALTGEQYDELMDLINDKANKKTVIERIKKYGIDVTSGVLAGIISSFISK